MFICTRNVSQPFTSIHIWNALTDTHQPLLFLNHACTVIYLYGTQGTSGNVAVAGGNSVSVMDPAGMSLILCGAIKICDLGHAFSSTPVHVRWSNMLEEELFKQVCPVNLINPCVSALIASSSSTTRIQNRLRIWTTVEAPHVICLLNHCRDPSKDVVWLLMSFVFSTTVETPLRTLCDSSCHLSPQPL